MAYTTMHMTSSRRGFTLLELLIVVSIIAVVLTVLTLVSDPRERLKEVRDNRRLRDLVTLNKALGIVQAQAGSTSLGSTSTTYLSLADASSTCANLGISQGSYACVTTSTLTNINGTGWVPVNFTTVSGGAPLSVLPVDPVNSTSSGFYYTVMVGSNGTWKVSAGMESSKYIARSAVDGGIDPLRVEQGSDVSLLGGGLPVGSPELWLDAAAITGLNNGDGLATWLDESGQGNNGTGDGSGVLPMYRTTMINSKPAIRFSAASSTYFYFSDFMSSWTSGEIFYVLRNDVDNGYNGFSSFGTASWPTNNAHYGYYGTIYDDFGSTVRYTVGDPPGLLSDWHIYNVSTAPNEWIARLDGTTLYSAGSNTVGFTAYPALGMSSSGIFLNGEVAEVLVYDSVLTPEMRSLIMVYLRDKYAL